MGNLWSKDTRLAKDLVKEGLKLWQTGFRPESQVQSYYGSSPPAK